jgi:hypothetical protein
MLKGQFPMGEGFSKINSHPFLNQLITNNHMITKGGWRIPDNTILGSQIGYQFIPIDRSVFKKDVLDKIRIKRLRKEYKLMHGKTRLNRNCVILNNKCIT